MSTLIDSQIAEAKEEIKKITGKDITDDRAFSHVLLKNVFGVNYLDQIDLVTDGQNDGGIDFLYYDDEESKLILCQSKYTAELSYDQIIEELGKMYSTAFNFKQANTGSYNDKIKKALQNAIDRLPEDNEDNIEFNVFTAASVDITSAMRKINSTQHKFPSDAVTIYSVEQIEKEIQKTLTQLPTVKYEKIKLDKAKNYVEYESEDLYGIQCNVLSTSIIQLYNKYAGEGLFDLNIRKYIRNTLVDSGVKRTLDTDRDNFWFLNNGIIIACTEFEPDGDTVELMDFSIVNGGQTTTLIGTYKGANTQEFYIPCKIVAPKNENQAAIFYTKIAEATNSQKPIYPRDLKSNAPEMVRLQSWLGQENIYLEIKRGTKAKGNYKNIIKNDELGQLLLSFVYQQPGTSRSGKRKMFDIPATYDKLFKVNYEKDQSKKVFVKDLIDLDSRYSIIEEKYKKEGLNPIQTEILKNGKQTIFALLGVCYRLANEDITEADLVKDSEIVANVDFSYGSLLSNYKQDDLEEKLDYLIKDLTIIIADAYQNAYNSGQTTSVSNFMKTDKKYYNDIVSKFAQALGMMIGTEVKKCIDIFKR